MEQESIAVSMPLRSILTPAAAFRLILGWGSFVILLAVGPYLELPVPSAALISALAVIVVVILVCAFGVVHEAEQLAHRLGDPYGTLLLTLSIVTIEVVLVAAVMLGPGEHPVVARDSVMAVSMIILNAVIGLSLLVGGLRHGGMRHNRNGTSVYLAMLVVLIALAFAVPTLIGENGAYAPVQGVSVTAVALGLYVFFLLQQMGRQADDFREVRLPQARVSVSSGSRPEQRHGNVATVIAQHRTEVLLRTGLLVCTVLPIVLLSHDMATLLDDGIARVGAPVAVAGILIALIVFLPESITSVRAALRGEIQRVSNLCHGALVSTVGLTIPAVLTIGLLTGKTVVLAETPIDLVLLGATLLLSVATFTARRVTATHGATHLAVFAVYVLSVFS